VQILPRGWDQHGDLPSEIRAQCKDVDQASAALVKDLKGRGLLDSTLVVWGGEFGRTVYSQGTLTKENYGRDHHPRNFTMWMAGGGVKPGISYGETDDFSYNIVENPVHINDLNATILQCMGIDHLRFTFKFQGLDQRLTGVEPAQVVKPLLA
jgi:arylsulfatase A-like enzyme